MEGPNYFRDAFGYFKRKMVIPGTDGLANAMQSAIKAHKFVLPEGGRVLDNDLRALPDIVRLPYSTLVLEYACEEDVLRPIAQEAIDKGSDDVEIQFMLKGGFRRDKLIVIAMQEDDKDIDVFIIFHSPLQNNWASPPFECTIPSKKEEVMNFLDSAIVPVRVESDHGMSQEWFQKIVWATMQGPVRAIYEVAEALSFSNITEMDIPAKKMTFTESRKKALPYDSYKVLVVDKTQKIVGAGRSEQRAPVQPGERRQSREHTRRGHDRTYKRSGKKIWINPMVINAGVGGTIIKDYSVK